jgi:hypothetical protein
MRIAALGLLIGSLCLAACDDTNDVILVPLGRTGTFTLQTVNGQALPVTIADSVSPPLRIDVLSGAITIADNFTFTDVTTFRQTLAGTVSTRSIARTGTYTVAGNQFTFVEDAATDCGRSFTGIMTGTTLRASLVGGATAVYIR